MRLPVAVFAILLLSGCATSGAKHWWSPATWFSDAAAKSSDKAVTKLERSQETAVKAAHLEVAKTGEALIFAPDSREVELARSFNDNANQLLNQASGVVDLAELQKLKALVRDLRSENVQVRAAAEVTQKKNEAAIAGVSSELSSAQKKLTEAHGNLRQAFDRENELANTLRNERVIRWSLAGALVLAAAGWAYVRFMAGGLPGAIGSALVSLERKNPSIADELRAALDSATNRHEQAQIAAEYAKAK